MFGSGTINFGGHSPRLIARIGSEESGQLESPEKMQKSDKKLKLMSQEFEEMFRSKNGTTRQDSMATKIPRLRAAESEGVQVDTMPSMLDSDAAAIEMPVLKKTSL